MVPHRSGEILEGAGLPDLPEVWPDLGAHAAHRGGVVGPNLDFKHQGSPIFVAAATWNHGPAMAQAMQARGIRRPTLTGPELGALLAFLRAASQDPVDAPLHLFPGQAAVGQQLFVEKRCAECHGEAGGRAGPVLAGRGVPRGLIQFAATLWNKEPAMLEAMRMRGISLSRLQTDEMAHLVAYLDSVRYFASSGDARRGWQVLGGKGCLDCHSVSVRDPLVPRNLALVRGLDSAPAIMSVLWNHVLIPVPGGKRGVWPACRPEEMADLMVALGSLGADALTAVSER